MADFNGMADLSGRSVIIMPGPNSYTYQAGLLRDYIQAGGYAWINVAGPNCSTDFAPGGVDYVHYSCGGSVNQSESIVNPTHSFIQGNFDSQAKALDASDFLNWNATDWAISRSCRSELRSSLKTRKVRRLRSIRSAQAQ